MSKEDDWALAHENKPLDRIATLTAERDAARAEGRVVAEIEQIARAEVARLRTCPGLTRAGSFEW